MTRLPILSIWPNETLDSQSMPMWMLAAASLPAGNVEVAAARRAGADEDRVVALGEQRLEAVDALAEAGLDAHAEDVADLLVDHRFRQAEARDLACGSCRRRCASPSKTTTVVAERHEVARNGQRGRTGADQRDALAVLLRGRPAAAAA